MILSATGKPYTGGRLGEAVRIYGKKAKIKKAVSSHLIRHTIATMLVSGGMPLRHVQELLGHENMNSTLVYLNLDIKDLQREYKKYPPRAKD